MTSRQLRIRGLESNKDMGQETATDQEGADTYITQVPQTTMTKSLSVGKVIKLRKFNATTVVKPQVVAPQTPQHSQNCFPLESLSANLSQKDLKDIRRLMQHPSTRPMKYEFHNQGSP